MRKDVDDTAIRIGSIFQVERVSLGSILRITPECSVLHTVASLDARHGGPSRTVVQLTEALARCDGIKVGLLSQAGTEEPALGSSMEGVSRSVVTTRSRLALGLGLPMRRALMQERGDKATLIHSHGIWHPTNHWAACAARYWQVPLIVHPRGMLEPWAVQYKWLKKRFAWVLFQRRDLETAQVFVTTSEMEYTNLRRLGFVQPVAIIPNGVAFPNAAIAAKELRQTADRERIVLFLSRVHPIKGLVNLIGAWSQITAPGWKLRIAGPDESDHWNEVAQLIQRLGVGTTIDYVGPVDDIGKAQLYSEADLFVLPTFSENFGLVVAEALAHGVPVITTRAAPWADLERYACGWWIETGEAPLADALRDGMHLTDAARSGMGARGYAYVKRFDWDRIAEETLALYRWVLDQGKRPGCVRVD